MQSMLYMNDYTSAVNWQYDDDNERRPKLVKNHLIDIHKKLSDIAKKEGFEFTTEVDYTQVNYTPVW